MRRGKALEIMRKGRQVVAAGAVIKSKTKPHDLLKILQSEITHELSSPCFQNEQTCPPEDFKLEWDIPSTQDIVLRKTCETGEEIAVSALLGSQCVVDGTYPRGVTMKVCVKKPGLSSFLLFDCGVSNGSYAGPEFDIFSARHLHSSSPPTCKSYTGPEFSDLDPELQAMFKRYLEARGVGESLMNYLLLHMHQKEQSQYLNWLQNLRKTVS